MMKAKNVLKNTNIKRLWLTITGATVVALAAPGIARAATINLTVPGTSDPWLAGMPPGSTASLGDVAPDQSPVQVLGLPLSAGTQLSFTATGFVSAFGEFDPPDGSTSDAIPHETGAENGISDVTAPYNSLVGIFLDNNQPNLSPAPSSLDFSTASSRDYLALSPTLKQVFFIGDGVTSENVAQSVIVPTGATRLYLGTMDFRLWGDNSGAFNVTVTDVPEPSSALGMVALGVLGSGAMLKRKLKNQKSIKLQKSFSSTDS